MLWSQIKLTSYDFSDLHIIRKFENRPGTGQFLRIFCFVVTYRRAPVGGCLCMITSADARPDTERHCSVPGRLSKRSAGHRTVTFTCNNVYFNIKFAIIPPKKHVVKIRKTEADSDSNGGENCNSTCSLDVIHPQLLKRYIYFCIYIFVFKSAISMFVDAICTSANTRRFSPVALRLINHRPVPGRASSGVRTGIGRFV